MKKLYVVLLVVFASATMWSQSPQKISYQAVIRNNSNALITSTTVGMQISILQGSNSGTPVYVENQTTSTNINGLVSLEIGSGSVVSGSFSAINWSNGPYFIKTETDITGGATYSISGVSELMSVPYALFSANSAPGPQGPQGPAGNNGVDGAIGATGPMGPQGLAGINGAIGATGPMGPQGLAGIIGASGATGPMGPQGLAGINGSIGATGPIGPQGTAGTNGAIGATGPMGPQGLAGNNGAIGATGPMGPQGLAGNNGAIGATGPMGPQGTAGTNGAIGATGPMGLQGVQGPAGPPGSGIVPVFLTKNTNYTIQNSDVTGELYITITGENNTVLLFTLPLAATVGAGKKINISNASPNFPNRINVRSSGSDSLFGAYVPAGSTIVYPSVNYLPVSISLISDGISRWIIYTLN